MTVRITHLYNIPLVTAFLLGLNHTQADIVNDIRQANQAIKDNPSDWRAVSEMFINAFNEFSQSINDVLEERGGKPTPNGHFLWTSAWKQGKLTPKNWNMTDFMSEEHNQTLAGCYCGLSCWQALCCDCTNLTTVLFYNPISCFAWAVCTAGMMPCLVSIPMYFEAHEQSGVVYKNYYENKIGKYVKQCIYQKLHVSSLQQAERYWTQNFITPTSNLLQQHLNEMKNNTDDFKLLLNLHRAYFCSDVVFTNKIDEAKLKNFSTIYQVFYDALAETLLNSANNDAEMDNIHAGLLLADGRDKPFIIEGTPYQHAWYYGINIEHLLLDVYQRKACINQGNFSEKVYNALQVTLPKIRAEHERQANIDTATQMGYAARIAAGV